jgi:flagellar biosynthesis/type III secretory pathway M-ring protein FliF/YscJ
VILEVLLTLVMVSTVVTFLAWPIIKGVDERVIDAERAELEDAKQAKYREIKDAELDRKAGRMTEEQWELTDRELRREAMQILAKIDTLGADKPAESSEQPSAS